MEANRIDRIIEVRCGEVKVKAKLNDSGTASAIWEALPIRGRANRWGDEIYFEIRVDAELEPNSSELVLLGELGYWPPGRAFCLFFGPTPISSQGEIRAASRVNVFGKIIGDESVLKKVKSGQVVEITRAD